MRIIKRVLLFPIWVAVGALSVVCRLMSNIFAYVIGAVMLLGLAAGVYMAVERRWEQVALLACVEGGCLILQVIEAMLEEGINRITKQIATVWKYH